MKRVFYSYLALTLILTPLVNGAGEPVKTEKVEPKPATYSVHNFTAKELASMKIQHLKSQEKPKPTPAVIKEKKPIKPKALVKKKKEVTVAKVKTTKVSTNKRYFEVTGYTAGVESTGKTRNDPDYGKTASGTIVKEGRTAACPRSMEYGTKIYIPSLDNTYTCEDRGGAITEGHLDIYFEDVDVALQYGRQYDVEVHVIKKQSL